MNKLDKIIKAGKETFSQSTAHGIPNIINNSNLISKLIWLLCVLISMCALIWFTYNAILEYLKYPIVTSINTNYESPAEFPTVAICSKYWVDDISFSEKDLKDMLLECKYASEDCKTNMNNYFERYYDDLMSYCYRFNSGKNMSGHKVPIQTAFNSGFDEGLWITWNTTGDLAVWIHDANNAPKSHRGNNRNGFINYASIDFETEFAFEKISDYKLGYPYNKCLEDVDLFKTNKQIIDYLKLINRTLNRDICIDICFDLDYIEKNPCNCTEKLGSVWDKCVLSDIFFQCSMDYYRKVYLKNIANEKCPQQCQMTTYLVETKISPFKLENQVRFRVYYKSLKHTVIIQSPKMILSDLISNVGGIIGVFLGISFLSFIEIIDFILQIIYILFFQNKKINNALLLII
jgi:hypothetical protein